MPNAITLHTPSDRAARLALAMVLALTLLVGMLLAGALALLREQTLDFARQQTRALTLAVSEQTVRTLQTVEMTLHGIEPFFDLRQRLIKTGSPKSQMEQADITAAWWTDASGKVLFDSNPADIEAHQAMFSSAHPLWNSVRSAPSHATQWLFPKHVGSDGVWPLIAVHPVHDHANTFRGLLIAAVNPRIISGLWREIDLGLEGSITLLHRNGDGLLREPAVPSTFGKNFANRPLFKDYLPEQSEGWYIDHSAADGVERLYQFRVPPSHPSLVVLVGQSTGRLLSGWWKAVAVAMVAWTALALVVGVLTRQLLRQWAMNRTAQELMREQSCNLRELSQRILQAQEQERGRISRELHDELGQSLTALKINLQSAQRFPTHDTAQALQDNLRIVDDTIAQVRALALALRPSILDNLGLQAALQWMGQQMARRAGLAFALESDDLPERLSEPLETACFRIAQEALTNIARHAHAQHAWVTLKREGSELVMRVQDNGQGMEQAGVTNHRATLGLAGMRERAALVQGTLAIESANGRGCTITLRCPLQAA